MHEQPRNHVVTFLFLLIQTQGDLDSQLRLVVHRSSRADVDKKDAGRFLFRLKNVLRKGADPNFLLSDRHLAPAFATSPLGANCCTVLHQAIVQCGSNSDVVGLLIESGELELILIQFIILL